MPTQTQRTPDQIADSIREANERILEYGRKAGSEFLEAYERTLLTYADYQDKLAEGATSEWLTQAMKAQANLTRDITGAFADAGRASLQQKPDR
jgi:hypothetical protein